jgi:hypothetical protein
MITYELVSWSSYILILFVYCAVPRYQNVRHGSCSFPTCQPKGYVTAAAWNTYTDTLKMKSVNCYRPMWCKNDVNDPQQATNKSIVFHDISIYATSVSPLSILPKAQQQKYRKAAMCIALHSLQTCSLHLEAPNTPGFEKDSNVL